MVKDSRYVPKRGDAIWLNFDPQAGREQTGRRPSVVLSPASYNTRSGLALVCPITRQSKGYPFEVSLPGGLAIEGVILADHVRSLEWHSREAERICPLPESVLEDVTAKIAALIDCG